MDNAPPAPPIRFRIQLLGGMTVTNLSGQVTARFRTRKTGLLLSYLALYPARKHSREALTDLFWPELPPEAARDNLSGCLSSLRRQLGSDNEKSVPFFVVAANRDDVWLNDFGVEVDVWAFEQRLRAAERTVCAADRCRLLESALSLYRGPLLNGVYEEWVLSEQTRLAERYALSLVTLAAAQESVGALESAVATAVRAQQADPYSEIPCQMRMRLLARLGRREAARVVFRDFESLLQQQIDCRPSPATQQVFRSIDSIASSDEAHSRSPSVPLTAPPSSATTAATVPIDLTPPSAPVPLTRLWGRESAVEQLTTWLIAPTAPRLITLTGPGGIGKTRLAHAATVHLHSQTVLAADHWVSLAEVPDVDQILPTLARTLGAKPGGKAGDVLEAICERLTPTQTGASHGAVASRVLLVMDNVEQLLPRPGDAGEQIENKGRPSLTTLVRLLLYRLPHLCILSTSRRALGLHGEQEFPLSPLSEEAATALFAERADLVRPGFHGDTDKDAIREIVRRVDGVPLAVEMIAGWSRTLTPSQIVRRLPASGKDDPSSLLNLLVSRARDTPGRHESIRKTLNWSLEMLPEDVRRVFTELSVFRGGWTVEAAEAVVGSSALEALQQLAEHSLITRKVPAQSPPFAGDHAAPSEERLRFLEPVRELASERLLQRDQEEVERVRQRHADYFIRMLSELTEQVSRAHSREALRMFEAEAGNCRSVVNRMIDRATRTGAASPGSGGNSSELIVRAVHNFISLLLKNGGEREVWELLPRVLEIPGLPPQDRFSVLLSQYNCCWRLDLSANIPSILDAAEAEAERAGSRVLLAKARGSRANYCHSRGHTREAIRITEQVMDEFSDVCPEGSGTYDWLLSNLGAFLSDSDDKDRAISVLERSVRISRTAGSHDSLQVALGNLACYRAKTGDYGAAMGHALEALEIAWKFGQVSPVITHLCMTAAIAVPMGKLEAAARLFVAGAFLSREDALRRGVPVSPYHSREYFSFGVPDGQQRLETVLRRYENEASQMTLDAAVAYAQSEFGGRSLRRSATESVDGKNETSFASS